MGTLLKIELSLVKLQWIQCKKSLKSFLSVGHLVWVLFRWIRWSQCRQKGQITISRLFHCICYVYPIKVVKISVIHSLSVEVHNHWIIGVLKAWKQIVNYGLILNLNIFNGFLIYLTSVRVTAVWGEKCESIILPS